MYMMICYFLDQGSSKTWRGGNEEKLSTWFLGFLKWSAHFCWSQKGTQQGKWPLSLLLLWPGVISYCWKLSNVRRFQLSRQNMTIFLHVGDSYIQPCTLLSFGWYTEVVCRFEIVFLASSCSAVKDVSHC